jgi:hypothetical protein
MYALKDCRLIKNYVNDTLKPRTADPPKKVAPPPDNNDDAEARYPGEDGAVHMIFDGSPSRPKAPGEADQAGVYNAESLTPSYLKWSEVLITFDRNDHPNRIPQLGAYPLVVAPLFGSKRVHKVLMDEGAGSTCSMHRHSTTWASRGPNCDYQPHHPMGSSLGWKHS